MNLFTLDRATLSSQFMVTSSICAKDGERHVKTDYSMLVTQRTKPNLSHPILSGTNTFCKTTKGSSDNRQHKENDYTGITSSYTYSLSWASGGPQKNHIIDDLANHCGVFAVPKINNNHDNNH